MGLNFYKSNWDTIKDDMLTLLNQMYIDGTKCDKQKHGLVVCLAQEFTPIKPDRPIKLLNTDYKILARIIANRLLPILVELPAPKSTLWSVGPTYI
jgi:hypothetical protein